MPDPGRRFLGVPENFTAPLLVNSDFSVCYRSSGASDLTARVIASETTDLEK